jgi:hypothetical protein
MVDMRFIPPGIERLFPSASDGVAPPAPPPVVVRPKGMVEDPNIDLSKRPQFRNPDGSVSTIYSASYERGDGKTVLIPLISDMGKKMRLAEAKEYWAKRNLHLGVFDSISAADAYAQTLHREQESMYGDRR